MYLRLCVYVHDDHQKIWAIIIFGVAQIQLKFHCLITVKKEKVYELL